MPGEFSMVFGSIPHPVFYIAQGHGLRRAGVVGRVPYFSACVMYPEWLEAACPDRCL
jgi:hypothetical protein